MKRIGLALLGLVALAVAAGAFYVLRPAPQASAPIETVARAQAAPTAAGTAARVFQIVPEESQARFVIDEVLRGEPKTVVGATGQVAGQIALDPADADGAKVGTILINARTFATDSTQRDRAIQNVVLRTADHEYVTFAPTAVDGLPDRLTAGVPVSVRITGDLTIGGVTKPATFDATVTMDAAGKLTGTASTAIRYADWSVTIPQVPSVTGVADTVRLELAFAATAA